MEDEIRRAIAAAPRPALDEIARATWRAYAAGAIDEAQAQGLAELIEARKGMRGKSTGNAGQLRQRRPARSRSPASIERRRRWVASGWLPPALAACFTPGETAALAVVASEVRRAGACALALDHIATLAGVGRTTVRNALAEARRLGLLTIEERRASAWRNLPNIVRVVSGEWRSWLDMRRPGAPRGEGAKSCAPQSTHIYKRRGTGYDADRRHGSRQPGLRAPAFA